MAQRYLVIENYRNIGIAKEQKLLLNTSIDKTALGDIVVIVGPNNSGKSNCLSALLSCGKAQTPTTKDLPDFDNKIDTLKLGLIVQDDDFTVGKTLTINKANLESQKFFKKRNEEMKTTTVQRTLISQQAREFFVKLCSKLPLTTEKEVIVTQEARNFGKETLNYVIRNFGNQVFNQLGLDSSLATHYHNNTYTGNFEQAFLKVFDYLKGKNGETFYRSFQSPFSRLDVDSVNLYIHQLTTKTESEPVGYSTEALKIIEMIKESKEPAIEQLFNQDNKNNIQTKGNLVHEIINKAKTFWDDKVAEQIGLNYTKLMVNELIKQLTTPSKVAEAPEISQWENSYDLSLSPEIISFKEREISQKDLSTSPKDLNKSHFFEVLLKSINYKSEDLDRLYSSEFVTGSLRMKEKEINCKLEKLSDQFNKLFFQRDSKYRFEILLESTKIEFQTFVGDLALHLDKQSTGFRWFFNFYFTVIAQKGLKRGDIVIMDEPATNLHVSGIQELRGFIKDYARRSQITFVISTHSPFFIDVDNLDEVRVVNRIENQAVITNMFHAVGEDDTDALRPIKDALTVGRHILVHPSDKTIFVEGITDYCYLTMFKTMFESAKGLHFMPIQGLKKDNLLSRILRIDPNPTILVDNDHYGNGLETMRQKHAKKDHIEIIKLDQILPTFTDIESLFDPKDKPSKKSFETAVTMKNAFDPKKYSPITKKNFEKLFENISV